MLFQRNPNSADVDSEIGGHDPLAIVASCGGLTLIPANVPHRASLRELAERALKHPCGVLEREPVDPLLIRRWAAHVLEPDTDAPAPNGLVTGTLTYSDGPHVVLAGGDAEVVFALRLLLQALFFDEAISDGYTAWADRLCGAVLRLSSHLCHAAGLDRHVEIPDGPGALVVPDAATWGRMAAASFAGADVLVDVSGGELTTLDPLCQDISDDGVESTLLRPIVRRGDRYAIADPAALLVALRHALLARARDEGLNVELTDRVRIAAAGNADGAFRLMRWESGEHHGRPGTDGFERLTYLFDDDKLAHVLIVADPAFTEPPSAPYAPWDPRPLASRVDRLCERAEYGLLGGDPEARANELLHVVILVGAGRPVADELVLQPGLGGGPRVVLTAEALQQASLSDLDALALFKFGQARQRLTSRMSLISREPLDTFAAWKALGDGFYADDEARPGDRLLVAGEGHKLREHVAREVDLHGAEAEQGDIVDVVRAKKDPAVPLHTPVMPWDGRARRRVSGGAIPIWVVAARRLQPPWRGFVSELVETVAYWLWQLAESLEKVLREVSREDSFLRVFVDVVEDKAWTATDPLPEPAGPVAEVVAERPDYLQVRVLPAFIHAADRPDNLADRELMRLVLQGTRDLAPTLGLELADERIAAILDDVAPVGPKRMFLLLHVERDVGLKAPVIPYRIVQPADTELLLDELGPHLRARLGLAEGPIGRPRQTEVFEEAVAFLYSRLTGLVASMDPTGLLETLVAHHEATIQQQAHGRITAGARAACFGETRLVERLRESIPENFTAARAQRFAIEYVCAKPPVGLRPVSQSTIDEIVATCSLIVEYGTARDLVAYELEGDATLRMRVLPSGRLGISRDTPYQRAREEFFDAWVPGVADNAIAGRDEQWPPSHDESPAFIARLDAAAAEHWGFTMSELTEGLSALVDRGLAERDEPIVIREDELRTWLAGELGWEHNRVNRLLELFVSRPRDDFLRPPQPHKPSDTYPWLLGRPLSYDRRPLLVRPGAEGSEVIYGFRQVDNALRFLFELIEADRLRDPSPELARVIDELVRRRTRAFVATVATAFRDAGLDAHENVRKIDGLRPSRTVGGRSEMLGDLDVLVVDRSRRRLLGVECKDLQSTRSGSEHRNQLDAIFVVGYGKRAKVEIHLERLEWLHRHREATLRWLGIVDDPSRWTVEGAMVVGEELLAPRVRDSALPVVSLRDLRAHLASGAAGASALPTVLARDLMTRR